MGLAVCRELVELMEGSIGVESRDEKGSIFWFAVPLSHSVAKRPFPFVHINEMEQLRVLIVDSDRNSRDVLQEQFALKNVQATGVGDGVDALSLLSQCQRETPFRVVVADMNLEGMDGTSFGRLVKRDPALADVPLIMLTSSPRAGQAQEVQDAGFAAYLTRPVSISDLYDCVRAALGVVEADGQGTVPLITRHTLAEGRVKLEEWLTKPNEPQ